MQRLALTVALTCLSVTTAWSTDVVIFVDGTRMEVSSYEVKGELVVLITAEGLRSVPRSYVDMEATERANRGAAVRAPQPAPSPRRVETLQEPILETTQVPVPEPTAPGGRPTEPGGATPVRSEGAGTVAPPPVWTNDELDVSLVVPSSAWEMQALTASYDVAVRLDQPQTGAMATLGLIRQRLRSYKDFQEVVQEVHNSISAAPDYQFLGSKPLALEPYTAQELVYLKDVEGVRYFNRMVIYYSRDLAYVLSLSCPQESQGQNQADFDALVRGLVIKKVRKDITAKGAPRG